jgi:hypothetical protein
VKDSVNVLKGSNIRQFTEWFLALPEEYKINKARNLWALSVPTLEEVCEKIDVEQKWS